MNNLILAAGLNHIAIKIFQNLNDQDLDACTKVQESWKILIEDQRFYWNRILIRKIENLRKQHPKLMSDTEVIREFKHHIQSYNKIAQDSMKNSSLSQKRKWLTTHINFGVLETFEISKEWINFLSDFFLIKNTDKFRRMTILIQNIDEKNIAKTKMSPIEFAAYDGHLEIVMFIVENIKARNTMNYQDTHLNPHSQQLILEQCTPLHCAASRGHIEIVKYFCKELKNLNCFDAFRSTPLHYASHVGHAEIVKLLVDQHQVFSSPKDNFLRTPLHEAVRFGYFSVVKILVPTMNDISTQDFEGKTPLDHAVEGGYYNIVNFLKARSAKQGEFSSLISKSMALGFYVGPPKAQV